MEQGEFAFIGDDAARLGVEAAPVERIVVPPGMSGLKWRAGDPTLALLHGAGLHAHSWNSVALVLSRPLISLDLPGHGHSEWRDDAIYTAPAIAPAVTAAIAGFSHVDAIAGHSLGGLAAILVASALPDQVHSLVLVDVTPGFRKREQNTSQANAFMSRESFESRDEVIQFALDHGLGSSREALARGVYLNTRVRDDGRVEFRHHLSRLSPASHRNHDPELLWEPLAALDARVLLVRGTNGILDEEHVEEFRSMVPSGTVVALETGHNVHRDDPKGLARAITEFLGR